LVELLMVIAIIGILVGMGVVGINAGAKAIQKRAIALEVAAISQAVEAYKMKYGDYPPDGSSRAAFEAHFRKAFPNIKPSEFGLLVPPLVNSQTPASVMDPAEALVFCLGGFSNNPQLPFSGAGGPFSKADGGGYQYNVDRSNGFFEFGQEKLTLGLQGTATQSNDEVVLGTGNQPDALPVYLPRGRTMPLVYFAASTYSFSVPQNLGLPDGTLAFNAYRGNNISGVARPYKSDNLNTSVLQPTARFQKERRYRYMNDKSFQIISAGLDDDFGGVNSEWIVRPADLPPTFFRYPSGKQLNIDTGTEAGSNYQESDGGGPSPQLDNVTNFSEGPLEDSLP
jgi:type II secretory pathway pseudopilin PulG